MARGGFTLSSLSRPVDLGTTVRVVQIPIGMFQARYRDKVRGEEVWGIGWTRWEALRSLADTLERQAAGPDHQQTPDDLRAAEGEAIFGENGTLARG